MERALSSVPGLCLAIDIGATKFSVGSVRETGEILVEEQRPVPVTPDEEVLFAGLSDLVASVVASTERVLTCWRESAPPPGFEVCGVGTSGPMARGGVTVSPLNLPAWREFPLAGRLACLPLLEGLPLAVENDAKALALGEGWLGGAQECDNYLAMVVSTGVGGGIVLDGHLLDGDAGNAGHIGHVIVEPAGELCGCGARGCLEAEASGTALARLSGGPPALAAARWRERSGMLVGRAVASVANLLDLPLALVGGSVALGFGETFFAAARAELAARALLDFSRCCRIEPVGLGRSGPLIGAATVGWTHLGRARRDGLAPRR